MSHTNCLLRGLGWKIFLTAILAAPALCMENGLIALAQDAFLSPSTSESHITPLAELTNPAGDLDSPDAIPGPSPVENDPLVEPPENPDIPTPQMVPPAPTESPSIRLERHPEIPVPQKTESKRKTLKEKAKKPDLPDLRTLNPFRKPNEPLPVGYAALPGIAVFAVVKHGNEKAFSDLPLLFAREYALRLEGKAPDSHIYNPVALEADLRARGLGYLYDQAIQYYLRMGRPDPTSLSYLLKRIEGAGPGISRVIFVETDLDTLHPDAATGPIERAKKWMTDGMPQGRKYFVCSRLQVFDAEKPELPMVWAGSWRRSVPVSNFFNVTPSVFAESDSQQAFSAVSREMSRELLFITPKAVYMAPLYDTSVRGRLASGQEEAAAPPSTANTADGGPGTSSRVKNEQRDP